VNASPGGGPDLHKQAYAEVFILLEGEATFIAGGEERQVRAGEIVVVLDDTPHRFFNSGQGQLRQVAIHALRHRMARWRHTTRIDLMSPPMSDAGSPGEVSLREANELRRRSWAKEADSYDKRMGFIERRILGSEHRGWACSHTTGKTLEVAVGTGLNLASYPPEVDLVGLDLSSEMLEIAQGRAKELGREVDLRVGDAHALPFDAESFDSVLCTFSLCNIPEPRLAVAEMKRVLRSGGHLVLVDHIGSDARMIFWIQRAIEFFSIRSEGEHMTRRSLAHVTAEGFEVVETERMGPGRMVERILARKPSASESA